MVVRSDGALCLRLKPTKRAGRKFDYWVRLVMGHFLEATSSLQEWRNSRAEVRDFLSTLPPHGQEPLKQVSGALNKVGKAAVDHARPIQPGARCCASPSGSASHESGLLFRPTRLPLASAKLSLFAQSSTQVATAPSHGRRHRRASHSVGSGRRARRAMPSGRRRGAPARAPAESGGRRASARRLCAARFRAE
jgi:hypothetical protein